MGPDLSILFKRNKKDVELSLTNIFFDLTEEIFLDPKGEKMEKFGIFRGNFPKPEVADLT